ncbi:MAG: response regulator [Lentisphaerae bacterium]|nr:response regulator [Lentisphaerota bacterium]
MAIPLRLLILEDRPSDAELILRELRLAGYAPNWERIDTEPDFISRLDPALDVILADYSMPHFNAPRALELLQAQGLDIPFIIVSGTVGEDAAVAAIKQGATDYLLKDRLRRIGSAVQQAIAQRRQRHIQRRLTHLDTEISQALISYGRLADTLRNCCEALVKHLDIACARIWTITAPDQPLTLAARAGTLDGPITGFPDQVAVGIDTLGRIAAQRQPRLLQTADPPDALADVDWPRDPLINAAAVFPLVIENKLIGVLALLARQPLSDLVFVTARAVANQLALAIQHRRALEALADSEERFRQIAENIDEVFWLSNPETTDMLYVSPAYESVWGRSRESVYENARAFTEAVHPADRHHLETAIRQKHTDGHFESEYRILRPDGSERWIRDRAFPIVDDQGRIYRIAGIAQDITERKELERQLIQAQKMEAMGQLAGGVAHDFNNLLLVITLAGDLLLSSRAPDNPDNGYVDEILRACNRASQLTRQLLAFSRKQVMELRVIDLNDVVATTEKMLRRLIGANIELSSHYAPALGRVRADAGQIEQVIINIVVNARDAMPNGGTLTIETDNVNLPECPARHGDAPPPGEYVRLTIRDTGTGMSPEVMARLFEPFFTTKPAGKGTGLGLATCFGIIRQSGGLIAVESAPGKGSAFMIYLPRDQAHLAPPLHAPSPDARPRGSETVLLVEDEAAVRKLAARALRQQGYKVLEAADGADGLRTARELGEHLHLLVTDLVMPHLGGKAMSDQILAFSPATRVLYCSGYMDATIAPPRLSWPATAFLQKPFTFGELIRKVRDILDG